MTSAPPVAPAAARDQLQKLSEVAEGQATRLDTTAGALGAALAADANVAAGQSSQDHLAKAARRYLRARRRRDFALGEELFADPCWDILLELYASQVEGRQVTVSNACIASAVPATTALRWLSRMEQAGLVTRTADPRDARRIYLQLSERSAQAIGAWLEETFSAKFEAKSRID